MDSYLYIQQIHRNISIYIFVATWSVFSLLSVLCLVSNISWGKHVSLAAKYSTVFANLKLCLCQLPEVISQDQWQWTKTVKVEDQKTKKMNLELL